MTTTEPTTVTDELLDAIDLALENAPAAGLTPSQTARQAHTDTVTASQILAWMVREHMAHTTGNGCWAHYHRGAARDHTGRVIV